MKSQAQAALQFSGYPLRIVPDRKASVKRMPSNFMVSKIVSSKLITQVNKLVNAPINWDVDWFQNYE